jgi:CheY-like chemotaxis protein
MFMRKSSFTYATASNGLEAVQAYKEFILPGAQTITSARRFDHVLMDISMPVINGLEATKAIRDFEAESDLRPTGVIALTGLASREAQSEAESVGVDVFLPKPAKITELRKLLVVG